MEKSYSAERRSQGVRKSKFVGEVLGEPDRDVRIIFAGSEKEEEKKEDRVLIFIGPQDVEKAAAIDYFCNFFYGMERENPTRFHIADEKFDVSTPEKPIIIYVFNGAKTSFRPILIDFKTEEGDAYKAREDLFLKWFQQNDRLRVDAICATFSSADISLQEHKIDFLLGVLRIFPADMQENLVLLLNNTEVPPEPTVHKLGLGKRPYFKLHTSTLYQTPQSDILTEALCSNYWRFSRAELQDLNLHMDTIGPKTFNGMEFESPRFRVHLVPSTSSAYSSSQSSTDSASTTIPMNRSLPRGPSFVSLTPTEKTKSTSSNAHERSKTIVHQSSHREVKEGIVRELPGDIPKVLLDEIRKMRGSLDDKLKKKLIIDETVSVTIVGRETESHTPSEQKNALERKTTDKDFYDLPSMVEPQDSFVLRTQSVRPEGGTQLSRTNVSDEVSQDERDGLDEPPVRVRELFSEKHSVTASLLEGTPISHSHMVNIQSETSTPLSRRSSEVHLMSRIGTLIDVKDGEARLSTHYSKTSLASEQLSQASEFPTRHREDMDNGSSRETKSSLQSTPSLIRYAYDESSLSYLPEVVSHRSTTSTQSPCYSSPLNILSRRETVIRDPFIAADTVAQRGTDASSQTEDEPDTKSREELKENEDFEHIGAHEIRSTEEIENTGGPFRRSEAGRLSIHRKRSSREKKSPQEEKINLTEKYQHVRSPSDLRSPGAPITPAATTSKVLAPLPPKSPEMIRRQQLLQKTNVDVLKPTYAPPLRQSAAMRYATSEFMNSIRLNKEKQKSEENQFIIPERMRRSRSPILLSVTLANKDTTVREGIAENGAEVRADGRRAPTHVRKPRQVSEEEREEMLPLPRIEPLFRMERPTQLITSQSLGSTHKEEKKLPLLPHSRQSAVPAAISSLPDKPLPRLPPTADSLAFYPAPSLAPALDSSQTPTASTPYRKPDSAKEEEKLYLIELAPIPKTPYREEAEKNYRIHNRTSFWGNEYPQWKIKFWLTTLVPLLIANTERDEESQRIPTTSTAAEGSRWQKQILPCLCLCFAPLLLLSILLGILLTFLLAK